MTQQAVTH
jgi:hypothetical protein